MHLAQALGVRIERFGSRPRLAEVVQYGISAMRRNTRPTEALPHGGPASLIYYAISVLAVKGDQLEHITLSQKKNGLHTAT